MTTERGGDDGFDDGEGDLFHAMVEQVGVGVALYGADGRYRYVNPAYAAMLGYDEGELLEMAVWDVNPDVDPDRFDGYWASFRDGETKTAEARHRTVDGDVFPVETVTTRIDDAGTAYNVGTITDVSERRAHERALERQNERLESFASVVSHDLRSPLNVVLGRLDLYRDDRDDDHLEAIGRAAERMEDIIEDLLMLTRTEGDGEDELEVDDVSLAAVARRAWETVPGGGSLTVEDGRLAADETKLQTLLENLFRNAVQHGGSEVEVTVERTERGFAVADSGSGIPDERREKVFESGYSTRDEGTGLGLAIVDRIAGAHGWTVDVGESSDGGARFHVET